MTNTITREQIKDHLNNHDAMILIEALPQKYFDEQHLPGALNIPHDEIQQKANEYLPDKDAFIVVYCASSACQNSTIAVNTLQKIGYNNTFEYVEGKQHWLDQNLPVETTTSK